MARSFDIQPGEFWEMTLPELLAEAEARRGPQDGDYAGGMTRGEVEELRDWMNGSTPSQG